MKARLLVDLVGVSEEELYQLLQAIRDCEQAHFKEKVIAMWVDVPEIPTAQAVLILARIRPPFVHGEIHSTGKDVG